MELNCRPSQRRVMAMVAWLIGRWITDVKVCASRRIDESTRAFVSRLSDVQKRSCVSMLLLSLPHERCTLSRACKSLNSISCTRHEGVFRDLSVPHSPVLDKVCIFSCTVSPTTSPITRISASCMNMDSPTRPHPHTSSAEPRSVTLESKDTHPVTISADLLSAPPTLTPATNAHHPETCLRITRVDT